MYICYITGVPQTQSARRWSGPSGQAAETSSPCRWHHCTHGKRLAKTPVDLLLFITKYCVHYEDYASVSFSQQPARFSNRCLQTIGRCWPHLRALGVGGAGCGIQGLASLGKQNHIYWIEVCTERCIQSSFTTRCKPCEGWQLLEQ